MSDTHLIFGYDPNDITAVSSAGVFVVTLIFSAIGAVFAYKQRHPKPELTLNVGDRISPSRGIYTLKVHNVAAHPIQVSKLWVDSESAVRLSGDHANYLTDLMTSAEIMPGAHAVLSFSVKSVPDEAPLKPFVIRVGWHAQGTASRMKQSSLVCYR